VSHHPIEIHAGPVRKDQPRPNNDRALWPYETRLSYWPTGASDFADQQILARRCVVHISTHNGLYLTRQVGVHITFKRRAWSANMITASRMARAARSLFGRG